MQPTVIKIKFTPTIRHLEKDKTKCCLEIVPDVACIQNLDTIEWSNEKKLVEYSVPVTYKIILKRNEDTARKQERIYYSCIDLRLLSRSSTLACGDITKVISDNYILSKVYANFGSCSTVSKTSRRQHDIKTDFCLEDQKSVSMTEELNKVYLKPPAVKKDKENKIAQKIIGILPSLKYIGSVDDKKPIRHIYTECTISKEPITDTSDIRNDKEKKRKLTKTSVCTLNTMDHPAADTIYDTAEKNDSKIFIQYNSKNNTDYKTRKVTEALAIDSTCYLEDNKYRIKNASPGRTLPELRVAHFMMTIENEILPLKILLSEIYRKCASLGFLSGVVPKSAPAFCPNYRDKFKFLNINEKNPRCNRVVYTIVFEE